MHDRRIQSGLLAFVQEHRVEHLPRRRVQTERDVRQARAWSAHRGDASSDPRIASMVSMPSRRDSSWPVQIVKVKASMRMSDSSTPQFVVMSSISRSAIAHLLVGGAGLALLVDGQRDHRGAVLGDQLHGLLEPRLGAVAVLVVHRVDRAPAAEMLQTGLQHRRFGGVEHDRQRRRGGQPARPARSCPPTPSRPT